jgi:predicted acetyltransferase
MMKIEIRNLSLNDGQVIYEMLQEMPTEENGFLNAMHHATFEEFKSWLLKSDNESKGIGLEEWRVPQSIFWFYVDDMPVGFGKVRHRLTEKLLLDGGNIGYGIRPSARGKGYGTIQLKLLLEQAKEIGIERVLLTINNDNINSIKLALSNGGKVEIQDETKCRIWIDC